jgi:hypothetical protein
MSVAVQGNDDCELFQACYCISCHMVQEGTHQEPILVRHECFGSCLSTTLVIFLSQRLASALQRRHPTTDELLKTEACFQTWCLHTEFLFSILTSTHKISDSPVLVLAHDLPGVYSAATTRIPLYDIPLNSLDLDHT